MKVICIDDKPKPNEEFVPEMGLSVIKEGCEYTVVWQGLGYDDVGCKINPAPVYELAEDIGFGYPTWRFVPLSSIDEKEFERNYIKETV